MVSPLGISTSRPITYPLGTSAYVYTDRPIYRPGDTVYFRFVVRQVTNGRYILAGFQLLSIDRLMTTHGQQVARFELPLSGFGTAHGEYTLPSGCPARQL